MSNPDKISIVVVTYHNDFLLLQRLLQSIYKYWNPNHLSNICIILNDRMMYSNEFNKLIENNTNSSFKIKTFFAYDLEPKIECFDWHSQQLLKCLSANIVDTDWYVINDCKDFYINPVDISDIFDEEGRATIQLDHSRFPSDTRVSPIKTSAWAPGPFSLALKNSFEVFNIDFQDHKRIHFPTTTPFIVKTEIMRNMVSELKQTLKGFFRFLFSIHLDGQSFVTEFLLYGAYCFKTTGYKDYADWNSNHRKFYTLVSQSKDLRIVDLPTNTSQCNVE